MECFAYLCKFVVKLVFHYFPVGILRNKNTKIVYQTHMKMSSICSCQLDYHELIMWAISTHIFLIFEGTKIQLHTIKVYGGLDKIEKLTLWQANLNINLIACIHNYSPITPEKTYIHFLTPAKKSQTDGTESKYKIFTWMECFVWTD